jgi:hypothetical protein
MPVSCPSLVSVMKDIATIDGLLTSTAVAGLIMQNAEGIYCS